MITKTTFASLALLVIIAPLAAAQYIVGPAFPSISFTKPVDLQSPSDGTDRLFVVEQPGRIRVFDNDETVSDAPIFLDIMTRVNDNGGEEGLLGLAFDPDYASNGYFFVNYTASDPRRTVISRFSVDAGDPDLGDPNSELIILEIGQPAGNHNGGQIRFGPDSLLYIAVGDGGGSGDLEENGQDRKTLLGTILRIDVSNSAQGSPYEIPTDNPFVDNTEDFREEIYAWGLRNPWRFSFDAVTGDLWAGDVGQGKLEEIDLIENGGNYGWNTMEGEDCFDPPSGCDQSGLELPIFQYNHDQDDLSITGGFVYRGARLPDLVGQYIYADFASSRIWALEVDNGVAVDNVELADEGFGVSSFGVDQSNELYIVGYDGTIYSLFRVFTGVDDPEVRSLQFNTYPNPFRESTTISFVLDQPMPVKLEIYDVLGRHVGTVMDGMASPGENLVNWSINTGETNAPGIYLVRFTSGELSFTVSMVAL